MFHLSLQDFRIGVQFQCLFPIRKRFLMESVHEKDITIMFIQFSTLLTIGIGYSRLHIG